MQHATCAVRKPSCQKPFNSVSAITFLDRIQNTIRDLILVKRSNCVEFNLNIWDITYATGYRRSCRADSEENQILIEPLFWVL
jgi:hypothetical protein